LRKIQTQSFLQLLNGLGNYIHNAPAAIKAYLVSTKQFVKPPQSAIACFTGGHL
jgi:hypothetical protein